jgi:hypothetical protein
VKHDESHAFDRISVWSLRLVLISITYIAACIPAILIAEASGLPEAFYHGSQLLMCVVCTASAAVFLFRTRASPANPVRTFAYVAMLLSAAWLAFVAFAVFFFVVFRPLDGM